MVRLLYRGRLLGRIDFDRGKVSNSTKRKKDTKKKEVRVSLPSQTAVVLGTVMTMKVTVGPLTLCPV